MITRMPPPPPEPPRNPPLRPGANMRAGSNRLGMWLDVQTNGSDFRHPWMVTAFIKRVRVGSGLILAEAGIEPTIEGVPLSGTATEPVPTLALDDANISPTLESYVCVEVTPGEGGKVADGEGLVGAAKVEVVHRAEPYLTTGPTGRAPLALIFHGGVTPRVVQIAMFHFRYETNQPADGPRRHFFA